MVPLRTKGSSSSQGRGGAQSWGGKTEREDDAGPGSSLGLRSRPAAWPLGPRGPFRLRFQGHVGRTFARGLFPLDPWSGMSQDQGNMIHLPGLPGIKLISLGSNPLPRTRPLWARFCLGVCAGICFCVLAPQSSSFPPRACPPRGPSNRAFPSAGGARWLRRWTRVGPADRRSRGEAGWRAGGGELWAGLL